MEKKLTLGSNKLKMLCEKRNFFLINIIVIFGICVSIYLISHAPSPLATVQENHEEEKTTKLKLELPPSSTSGPLVSLKQITHCLDRPMEPRTQQRGEYWVLYNYIRASDRFKCEETITYTTHADYSFLDNVIPLLDHWQGPISIAIYAPGSDFQHTLESIAYLRDCTSPLVKQLVTFHIYFSAKHMPKQVPRHDRVLREPFNCSLSTPYLNISSKQMYKNQKNLLYPVNVGRNIARESAQTHFFLASDIELYPSTNLISNFLDMIAKNNEPLTRSNPRVFPLPVFEVDAAEPVPENKVHLQEMLVRYTAHPFHEKICLYCHNVPKSEEWLAANETKGLHVFHTGKRMGDFRYWEPFFIGTHTDPFYDERLSWEGRRDKMTQGYALCVMDYDFMILDNAFLVHKPGIKVYKKAQERATLVKETNKLIKNSIEPELKVLYGIKKGCVV